MNIVKQENCTVLLTRAEKQNTELKKSLEELGVNVLIQPVIDILPPESWSETDGVVRLIKEQPDTFDWILFPSSNSVEYFIKRLGKENLPATTRIAALGQGTNNTLLQLTNRNADLIPDINSSENIIIKLLQENVSEKRFLLPQGNRGRGYIQRELIKAGANIQQITVYRCIDRVRPEKNIRTLMDNNKIDWTTATSPAIATSLANMFGNTLRKTNIISISPNTSKVLRNLGFPPKKETKNATMQDILNEIKSILTNK
ncbi:MAG: uroporphyrinogen-III synthase [Planctomycetaceae bacterium]|jgi:uroporphyrinogen-III synthase|nr:uroporphyrinogen-III synthase [Planctomycetaceae bacterium]